MPNASQESAVSGPPRASWAFYAVTMISLSIGWGIRGNFGHEYGAMIAGSLAAIAGVLMLDRIDWHRRVAYFGLFGTLGWSFGGLRPSRPTVRSRFNWSM